MKKKLIVTANKKTSFIDPDNILRLEANGAYTIIHCKNGLKYLYSKNLKTVLAEIGSDDFSRVHNSHAIRVSEMICLGKGRGGFITMSDGSTVPVSYRKKGRFIISIAGDYAPANNQAHL